DSFDQEAPGAPADGTLDPLQADESGGPVGRIAHQPLHRAVAFDVAAESLVPPGPGELRVALLLVVGILLPGGDLEGTGGVRHDSLLPLIFDLYPRRMGLGTCRPWKSAGWLRSVGVDPVRVRSRQTSQ